MRFYAYLGGLAGLVLILAGTFYLGDRHGFNRCHVAMADRIAEATQQARLEEQQKQEAVNVTVQRQADHLAAINDQLSHDLQRLQQREGRRHLSQGTEAHCQGASGAELSGPDAQFLARLAARAQRQQEALKACYSYADTVGNR